MAETANEQGQASSRGWVMMKGTLVRYLARETSASRHELGAFWKWESMVYEMFTFPSDFSTKYCLYCLPVF